MVEKNFILVSDNAEIKDNKLNVYGIFDTIFSEGFPALRDKDFTIVVNLEISDNQRNSVHTERFEIKLGNEVIFRGNTAFTPTNPRHQFIHRISDIVFPKEGKYDINIHVDDKLVAKTYFITKNLNE